MDNHDHNFKNLMGAKKTLIIVFVALFNIFLAVLIISTAVGIQNKVKEGRYIGQEIETKNTIIISDTGEIYAKPDLALISFTTRTEAKTVASAMSENTERMNAVIDFVKGEGVESKDLKTTNFSIYPRYEWHDECGLPPCPQEKRILVGYEVTQSLQVKIRDLESVGDIIEGAASEGANQIGALQFTIDNQDELKSQARKLAIDKAKAKAKELASQLGVRLVRITNFSESSVFPRYYDLMYMEKEVGGGAGAPQIETGENKITVTITITYEIN